MLCTNTPGSFRCGCNIGYQLLLDNRTCADANECGSNGGRGPCDQICINGVGSFACSCLSGYIQTGYNCTAVTVNPATIAYIQVKASGDVDCDAWKTLPAQEVVYKSIKDEMEAFCKCSFTIQSLNLTCSDKTSATLRGLIDKALLSYLEQWVATEATISAPGVTLTVDSTCVVQIQSLDDPLCQAVSSGNLVSNHPYLFVGVGCAIAVVVVITGIVCGVALRWKAKKQIKVANPLYDVSVNVTAIDDYSTIGPATAPEDEKTMKKESQM
eukprot:Em0006g1513a